MPKEFGGATVHHCYREQNGVANILAKVATGREVFKGPYVFVVPSVYTLGQVWADINESSYSRLVNTNYMNNGHCPNSFTVELS